MQPLLKMDGSQCYCTSFEIGRAESKGRKGKSAECSSNQTVLLNKMAFRDSVFRALLGARKSIREAENINVYSSDVTLPSPRQKPLTLTWSTRFTI